MFLSETNEVGSFLTEAESLFNSPTLFLNTKTRTNKISEYFKPNSELTYPNVPSFSISPSGSTIPNIALPTCIASIDEVLPPTPDLDVLAPSSSPTALVAVEATCKIALAGHLQFAPFLELMKQQIIFLRLS